jgi:glycosyltransferase involved in cell wall biosynthesis
MAKILWYGDAISHTGFARVTHSVIEHLSKDNEIVLFAMNYNGDPHGLPYKVYPAAAHNPNDRFGIGRIQSVVQHEKPDIVICLNDIWIVNQVWERIHLLKSQHDFKFIAYFPIDSEWYTSPMLRYVKDFDFSVTFTVEQASRLMAHGVKPKKLGVIPHGLDQKKFYQIDQNEARKQLGLPPDKFIVFNGNRNQPRKNIDQTIKAFAEFAGNKDDVLLYLHMGEKDLGWAVKEVFESEMRRRGQDPTAKLCLTPHMNYMQAPSDERLNLIYNAVDVGINTANGEGWGLVPFEHAMCKKPQIVPNHTSCKDIWKGKGLLIDVAAWITDKDLGVERGIVNYKHAAELIQKLYEDKDYRESVAEQCYEVTQNPSYRWDKIAEGFQKAVEVVK